MITRGEAYAVYAPSIIALIAAPAAFDGKAISIVGYVRLDGPRSAIVYIHREDYESGISKNGLWVDMRGTEGRLDESTCHDTYCVIHGIFNARVTGHMDCCSGGIVKIERMRSVKRAK